MRRVTTEPIPGEVQATHPRRGDPRARAAATHRTGASSWSTTLPCAGRWHRSTARRSRELWTGYYAPRFEAAAADPDSEDSKQLFRIKASADHLADHFADVPLLLFAFAQYDPSGGSIFPAVWSAMLAARGEGVGSALTSVLAFRAQETFEVLGVPADEGWNMACCVTLRLSHRTVGRRGAPAGARGRVPQPLGRAPGLRGAAAALAVAPPVRWRPRAFARQSGRPAAEGVARTAVIHETSVAQEDVRRAPRGGCMA